MATGYYIGLGDKTTCRGTVLEGDNRFNLYGVLHSCEGDLVSCGIDGKSYQIYGGISHMMSHGRRMAGTLDSFSGCPCRAKLIPSVFTATYQNEVRPMPQTTTAITQPTNHSDRPTTPSSQLTDPKPLAKSDTSSTIPKMNSKTCTHPDRMEELANYIAGEMNRNIYDPAVMEMRKLIDYDPEVEAKKFAELPWYAKLAGPSNFNSIALAKKAAALAIWTGKVGQGMDWDHKDKIPKIIGGIWHKQGDHDYFYDIWSNIHYGYVGVAGGLTDGVLLDGAGVEQIGSDLYRQAQDSDRFKGPHRTEGVQGMRAWDDVPDRVSINIGMKLFSDYPEGGITADIIMDKVLAVPVEDWAKGVQAHACK